MASRVSLCLIVKNGKATLPDCLRSVAGLVHETIVVDTGSSDATKAVAASWGARVFDFPWCDSFAAARNESIRHAQGDWIFWLDADEFLDQENRDRLQDLIAHLGDQPASYVMRQRSAVLDPDAPPTLVEQCRLFPNHPQLRWCYRVHEQILPALNALGLPQRFTDIAIDHSGYTDPKRLQEKLKRNLRLLLLDEAEQPDDPFTLFNLAWAFQELGQLDRAVAYARRSLERCTPEASIVRKLFTLLTRAHDRLGRPRDALAFCRAGRARCPDDRELLFLEGLLLNGLGDPRGAEAALRTLRALVPGEQFACVDAGLQGHKALFHLGRALAGQGRAAAAEESWRAALAERPSYAPACEALAGLYLAQGRWEPFEEVVAKLPAEGPAAAAGLTLRARRHLAQGDFTAARRLLEEAVAAAPGELDPRLYLSRALLAEGQDPAAAERVLRELAAGAPKVAEVWRGLARLLKEQGRLAEAVAVGRSGLEHCPDDAALLGQHGIYLVGLGDLAGAVPHLIRALEREPAGPRAVQARHWLALVYQRQGRDREAEAQWRALVADQPDFAAAWEGLAELGLRRGRWDQVDECADRLEALPKSEMDAAVLRARVRLGRRELAEARQLLEATIRRHPQAVKPRLMHSRVLLQAGDEAAAGAALRDVLALDAGNREARHNLAVLETANGDPVGRISNPSHSTDGLEIRPTRPLRIAFASFYPRPFQPATPYEQPLGGSESALCYLAEALAARGEHVSLFTAGGATGVWRGLTCLPLTDAALRRLPDPDVLVVQNLAGQGRRLRQLLGPRPRLLFWSGHGAEQPAVQPLRDPAERAAYDAFVLVSAWQRGRYLAAFGLDPDKTVVLGNGISPAFEDLFGPDESIVAAKSWPPVLAYTSTPDHGLDLLLEAFPCIRAAVPGTTLEVYAGLRLYGFSDAEDQARYGTLYRKCLKTAGVELVGPVSQPELARRLRRTAMLAYPNTVPETYCIAAREALAAGCAVVSTAQGALPETTAGFARLLPPVDRAAYLDLFTSETVAVLNSLAGQEEGLRGQVTAIVGESTWAGWADRWVATGLLQRSEGRAAAR